MPDARVPDARSLEPALLALRNADGGWPYYPGKTSRLEPTCWALLATSTPAVTDIDPLLRWPRQDGWLVDVAGVPVNYAFNALAAIVMLQRPDGVEPARAIARKLLDVRGLRLDPAPMLRQDNSLQAWPWIDGTFSWVEPTAWCLLLLKQPKAAMHDAGADRVRVGEQMLIDRVCKDGGWNYGGSNVYGQELWAYVPTTALGLLAMQDRRTEPVVVKSLAHLREDVGNEKSTVALSMAAMALGIYGAPVDDTLKLLAAALPQTQAMGSVLGLAMAMCAIADGEMRAFRIQP